MSKGSTRRPGQGYKDGYERIWGKDKNDLDYMHPIDKPEDIKPDRLRFMRHSLVSIGCRKTADIIDWCADVIERKNAQISSLQEQVNFYYERQQGDGE